MSDGTADEWTIGLAEAHEMPFVFASWARSYRAAPANMRMPSRAYYDWQRDVIDRCLARGASVLLARDSERPVYLYGFLCAERVGPDLVAHYCYVKRDWRGRGVARSLLAEAVERWGDGARDFVQSHDADVQVDTDAAERARTGRRKGVDTRMSRKLAEMGFRRVCIETLLRDREAA